MCYMNCIKWGARALKVEEVENKNVIEVGSYDVNGSLRYVVELLKPKEYIGVDMEEGPGVDIVCSAENLVKRFGADRFDIVLSTCVFEHIKEWKGAVSNIKKICKPNGLIFFIVPSSWPYHGYPYDFWRFKRKDVENIFKDCELLTIEENSEGPGCSSVYAKIRKPQGFVEQDLSDYRLYSAILDKEINAISDKDLEEFKKKYSKKTALNQYNELKIRTKGKRGRLVENQSAHALMTLVKNIDSVMETSFSLIKSGAKTTVGMIKGEEFSLPFSLLIKRFNYNGIFHSVLRRIFGSKAKRLYTINLKFFKRGFNVQEPIGYLESEDWKGSLYISKYTEAENLVGIFWAGLIEKEKRLAEKLAAEIASWHLKGAVHGDLKWSNILVEKNLDGFKIFFIDLDQARLYSKPNIKGIKKDIERFYSYSFRIGKGVDDWVRKEFLPAYLSNLPEEIRTRLKRWTNL